VDGKNLHQLIGGKHPIIYRVSTIQGVWEMGYESGQLYDLYVFWLMKQWEMGNPIFCLFNCTGTFFFLVPLKMKTMGTWVCLKIGTKVDGSSFFSH
jgi:hypothetical protein